MEIKDKPSLQWPKPIYTLAEVRDKSKYCRFHQDHKHRIDECRHLKDQVETLIHQRKLQNFVQKTEPYRRQQRNRKNKELETRGKKALIREISMISRGLEVRGSSKSLKKAYAREVK